MGQSDSQISAAWQRWPDRDGAYLTRVHLGEVNGRPSCVGFEMWGTTPHLAAIPAEVVATVVGLARQVLATGRPSPKQAHELAFAVSELGKHRPQILPASARTEVTSESIRVPLREMVQRALDDTRTVVLAATVANDKLGREWRALGVDYVLGEQTRGYGEAHWRDVAATWLAAWRTGSDRPTSDVADKFTVSKSTAAKWVSRCRAMGLLPPAAGRGRAAPRKQDGDSIQ